MIWRLIRKLFRITVTVNTSKRKQIDFDELKAERCRQLAAEIGYPWPRENKAGR